MPGFCSGGVGVSCVGWPARHDHGVRSPSLLLRDVGCDTLHKEPPRRHKDADERRELPEVPAHRRGSTSSTSSTSSTQPHHHQRSEVVKLLAGTRREAWEGTVRGAGAWSGRV